jgi:glycerate kinase
MKILISPDKFKGSLSAIEVCNALAKGLKKSNSSLDITACPMADGGDGSLQTINYYLNLKPVELLVNDPLFRPIKSTYYRSQKIAYIEMSSASGLVLLKEEERNCMFTSSFGTGELIADAIQKGATTINLFIGGSATNDGGIGIASALGYRFFDACENLLSPIGQNLLLINRIDDSEVLFKTKEVQVKVICDVNTLLYGKNGAAYIYGVQKGASSIEIEQLNQGLVNLSSKLLEHDLPNISDIPGAGAAGGVGGGAFAFLGAQLLSGIQNFIEITQLETLIKECDLVITGEGKLDIQTEEGKVISGVCQLAKKNKKPIIAVCGDVDLPISKSLELKKVYTVLSKSKSVEEAIAKAAEKLVLIGHEIGVKFCKHAKKPSIQ